MENQVSSILNEKVLNKKVSEKRKLQTAKPLKLQTEKLLKPLKEDTEKKDKEKTNTEFNKFLIGGEYDFKDTWKGGKFEELHSLNSKNKNNKNISEKKFDEKKQKILENSGNKHEPFDNKSPENQIIEYGNKHEDFENKHDDLRDNLDLKDIKGLENKDNFNPFTDSHTIEEQIYISITILYILTRTYNLFKRTNKNKISKLGHFFIHLTLSIRFLINTLFLFLKTSFPSGKEILENKYFLESKIFLNFFSYKLNLSKIINLSRLFSDAVFISSLFLFASKYFSVTSPYSYSTGNTGKNTALKRVFIFYALLRIPLSLFFFQIYLLTPSVIATVFVLEISFICMFLFTQSIKLSVSRTSPATKTVYGSIVLLMISAALNFSRFFGLKMSEFVEFVIHKANFFVFLFLCCFLVEMFMKRTKSDFYDYFDDEELTISTTNRGVQFYVN